MNLKEMIKEYWPYVVLFILLIILIWGLQPK